MSDVYEALRSLAFPAVANALGIDLSKFRHVKDEWVGRCPIHGSKNNTGCFRYHDDGRFYCFSCGARGRGAIDLAKLVRSIAFKEAVELLQTIQPVQPPTPIEKPPVEADSVILKPYTGKYEKYKVDCPWLEARIPDAAVREKYGIFCYNNPARKSAYTGRVMIPVKDIQGSLFGYLGRAVVAESDQPQTPDMAKYLFPKNLPKSHFLFGAYELLQSARPDGQGNGRLPLKVVYLVESPFAVMKFASLGLPSCSAYGWAVSDQQLDILSQVARGVVYIPDTNKFEDSRPQVPRIAARLWVKAPRLPQTIDDPEYLSLEQIQALTH